MHNEVKQRRLKNECLPPQIYQRQLMIVWPAGYRRRTITTGTPANKPKAQPYSCYLMWKSLVYITADQFTYICKLFLPAVLAVADREQPFFTSGWWMVVYTQFQMCKGIWILFVFRRWTTTRIIRDNAFGCITNTKMTVCLSICLFVLNGVFQCYCVVS